MHTLEAAPDTSRLTAASALQRLVPELVALSLEASQARWNVRGPLFSSLQGLTNDLIRSARRWSDRAARRSVALGFAVDTRPGTVAGVRSTFPAGSVTDDEAVAELDTALERVAQTAHRALDGLAESDPVTHSLVVDVLEGLDAYRWQLRSQVG